MAIFWLAGNKRWEAWALGLANQGLWIAYAVATQQYGFILGAAMYGTVYARNLRKWLAERKPPPPPSIPWKQFFPDGIKITASEYCPPNTAYLMNEQQLTFEGLEDAVVRLNGADRHPDILWASQAAYDQIKRDCSA